MSLINELKRRNVLRVAAIYIVVTWLLIQVVDTIFPLFGFDDTPARMVVILMAIGFIPAVVLSWIFELTPEGFRKDKDIDRAKSIAPKTGKTLDRIIIVVLLAALAFFAFDKFILTPQRDARQQAQQRAELMEAREEGRSDALVASYGDHSIAVLPFVDMSSEKDQEYMSDGIAEELLNLLAKIPELRVTSRSSAFALKGEKISIPDIAERLQVAHVLEGSVRKAGNQIRITTQLIEGRSDTHLWSETYDRSLDDIFAVQDEIAGKVVEQLKLKLLSDTPTAHHADPEAYTLYLEGRHLRRQRTPEALEQATDLMERALELDPNLVAAWVEMAGLYATSANDGLMPIQEGYDISKKMIDRALAIDPDNAAAWSTLGYIAGVYDADLAASAKHTAHALQLEPGNPAINRRAAALLATLGRVDEAISLLEFAMAHDPLRVSGYSSLGLYNSFAGRLDEAIASWRTALSLRPNYGSVRYQLAMALLTQGKAGEALEVIEADQSTWRMVGLAMIYHTMGQADKSDALLAELIEQHEQGWAYNIAAILAWRGETDRAFEWLDKAVQYKDGGLAEVHNEPVFSNIHDDPRWAGFLKSQNKSPEQLGAIEFKVPRSVTVGSSVGKPNP